MSLRAGVAVRDISPRKPMFLVGYPHVQRISTGLHDPLLASALHLSDGATYLLLIGVDIAVGGNLPCRDLPCHRRTPGQHLDQRHAHALRPGYQLDAGLGK
jgi:hypothetical protein